jgi:NAD(P)-dependent dehydrogenase (short-subunit alcohol dehydrogenase family)
MGIGLAIVRAFAAHGDHVVFTARDPSRGEGAAVRVARDPAVLAAGGSVRFLQGDVSEEASVAGVVATVIAEHGPVEVLVNNAAIQHEALIHQQSVHDFHRVVDVNLLGTFLFTRSVIPGMLLAGRGVIVNLSSVLGLTGDPLLPVYSATKAAILGLTRSTAAAYAPEGLRCVAVCPGDVDTELNQRYFDAQPDPRGFRARIEREYPMRRIATPQEVASVVRFLASDEASFVTGSHVVVDGGILSRIYEV